MDQLKINTVVTNFERIKLEVLCKKCEVGARLWYHGEVFYVLKLNFLIEFSSLKIILLLQCYLDVLLCCGGTERSWSKQINSRNTQTHASLSGLSCGIALGHWGGFRVTLNVHLSRENMAIKYPFPEHFPLLQELGWAGVSPWLHQFPLNTINSPLTPSIPLPLLLPMDTRAPGRSLDFLFAKVLASFCVLAIMFPIFTHWINPEGIFGE